MSVKYCIPVPVFHFLAKTITHAAAQSLCDSWASCITCMYAHCRWPLGRYAAEI